MFFQRRIPKSIRPAFRWDFRSGLLAGLYQGMTAPFFGVIARRMGASALEISLLMSAPFIGHLLSMFVAWHMQHRPKKPYVLWLAAFARGLMLLMAFVSTSPLFIGVIALSQAASCFTLPAYASIMKDSYPDRLRGRLMGLVRVGVTASAMVAGLCTGRLLESGLPRSWVMALAAVAALVIAAELQRRSWQVLAAAGMLALGYLAAPLLGRSDISYRLVFPVAGVFGLLASWAFNHMPEKQMGEADPGTRFNVLDGLATLLTDRRFGLYSLAFFTFGFGNLLQTPLIPLFQVDKLNISNQWVGILAMVGAGVSALFYAVWGRFMDRHSPFLTVILCFAIWGLSPLVYANAYHTSTLLLASVLTGIASPGIDLTWLNAVMLFADRHDIPRYTALHTFLVGIRGLLAPFVATWLFGLVHLRTCFYISAAVIWAGTLVMTAVTLFVLRPARRPSHAPEPPARVMK